VFPISDPVQGLLEQDTVSDGILEMLFVLNSDSNFGNS
jgi:hypothetical protein